MSVCLRSSGANEHTHRLLCGCQRAATEVVAFHLSVSFDDSPEFLFLYFLLVFYPSSFTLVYSTHTHTHTHTHKRVIVLQTQAGESQGGF